MHQAAKCESLKFDRMLVLKWTAGPAFQNYTLCSLSFSTASRLFLMDNKCSFTCQQTTYCSAMDVQIICSNLSALQGDRGLARPVPSTKMF